MAEYVFTPTGVRVRSEGELPAPLFAPAADKAAPKRAAKKRETARKEG